jgi:hypothetical protein
MGSSGSFVAILLSVPLTVVALVGVVGVPKLQEMLSSTSSHEDDEFDREGFGSRSKSKRGTSKSDREQEEDAGLWSEGAGLDEELGDDFGSKPKSAKSKSLTARGGKSKNPIDDVDSELEEQPADDLFNRPSRSRFGQTPKEPNQIERVSTVDPFAPRSAVTTADFTTPAAPVRGGASGGFAAAIERLRTMGIERYHLEPGLAAGQFLFVCQVNVGGKDPTVHRFEAEAGDPALAVEDAMKQVAAWQAESSMTKTAGVETRR